ncbi:MAG: dienelactone hydrolase family protein [Actinomycetota bacterium]|nr:dienelactone hydrolase family protein [Actinomycetota bacterium]
MIPIALFHSVLGVRPGVIDAADRLRAAGHEVTVIDQYDGRVFDDYGQASEFAESIGYGALMQRAVVGVVHLPDGFIAAGFSNGGGMAEHVAMQRAVAGVVMLSGVLPLDMLGARGWPLGVPAQIHCTVGDPFRRQGSIDSLGAAIRVAGAPLELFDYPGDGHLFTDASLPEEYDPDSTRVLWERVLAFCDKPGRTHESGVGGQ